MPFPAVIDNTIRKEFVQCPMKAYFKHVENLRPKEPNVDLHFGGCFAKGMEVARKAYFEQGLGVNDAIALAIGAAQHEYGDFVAPAASLKTKEKLRAALIYYFETWPLEDELLVPVEGGIEHSFSFPLDGIMHPDTGETLHYAGRFDLLAKAGDALVVVDEKTASRLGDSFAWQWDTDGQMSGYLYSVQHAWEVGGNAMGMPVALPEVSALIRAVSILKSGFGHMEVPIVRSGYMLNVWYEQLRADVLRMIAMYQAGIDWDRALHSNACVSYNRPCEFTTPCLSPTPERFFDQYERVIWNPLEKK